MRHFATESGKSKGQFYTPAEVSRMMAKVIGAGSARGTARTDNCDRAKRESRDSGVLTLALERHILPDL